MRSLVRNPFSGGSRIAGLLLGAAALLSGETLGQVELSPTVNLFGDDIVQKLQGNGRAVRFFKANGPFEQATGKPAVEGYEQTLTFQDGRQIRGTLLELTKTEIHWKRPDADAVLVFPREQARRIALHQSNISRRGLGFFVVPGLPSPEDRSKDKPLGTIKLSGGDWLHGEVVSGSGDSFAVRIGDGPELEVDRQSVQWLHLGSKPVPAFGFAGGNLDLESWSARGGGNELKIEGGMAILPGGGWVGREMAAMQRFEMSFEVSAESENHTEVWLQPIGPEVNCYTTGTIVLRLGSQEFGHCIYAQQMQDVRTPIPKEGSDEKGDVRYRVLYDGPGQKLTVIRNGRQLGSWNFVDEKNAGARRIEQQFTVNGICFRSTGEPLKLRRLQVQPWIKDIASTPPGQGDCVLTTGTDSTVGTLGAVGRTDFFFSGVKQERTKEALLQFASDPAPMSGADAVLLFGAHGELSVGDLEIRGGKLQCRTAFSSAANFAAGGIQGISFPSKSPVAALAEADRLVFKNGDEIGGKLITASEGEPVRWQMLSGQEIAFGRNAIAGIRLAKASGFKIGDPAIAPIVELRNGDLIRGDVAAADHANLRIRNQTLGEITVAREKINILLPNTGLSGVDGGFRPEDWMNPKEPDMEGQGSGAKFAEKEWVYLDGAYILRPQGAGRAGSELVSLSPPLSQSLDRFELRCDVTDPSGNDPRFSVSLREKQSVAGVQASFAYGRLQLFMNSRQARGGPNWRHIMFEGKVKDATSRRRLRIFVDSKLGTAAIYLDGVLLTRIGQQANERLPGIGGAIRIQGYGQNQYPTVFSNLWVGPWNGDLPTSGNLPAAGIALTNGDFASGAPSEFVDGKIRIESDIGPLDLPVEKVLSVHFGGECAPASSAARLRLVDGTSIHVDAYNYQDGKITAKSAMLGELVFDAAALAEIAVQPTPVRPPQNVLAKKEASEPRKDEQADQ